MIKQNCVPSHLYQLPFSDQLFHQYSRFIYSNVGIHLPPTKKVMLQARLARRLKKLNLSSFEEYFSYVTSEEGLRNEMPNMVNAVTTNKTDFFREPQHFKYLTENVLPEFYHQEKSKKFKIWSAACATGPESYTMAMLLQEFALKNPGFRFAILSTDISTEVLDIAHDGFYHLEMAKSIPKPLRKKYVLRAKDVNKQPYIRIVPELRKMIQFKQLNLMDQYYPFAKDIDVIFCRNVFIYFDRKTQECVIRKLCSHIRPGGYLFIGHSETIRIQNPPFQTITSTIYKMP
jgi:chemotaxis protein methyltransferase CheR